MSYKEMTASEKNRLQEENEILKALRDELFLKVNALKVYEANWRGLVNLLCADCVECKAEACKYFNFIPLGK